MGRGWGVNNPREVTERVHEMNGGRRKTEAGKGHGEEMMVQTYDLKDFFTNVDRESFMEDIRKAVGELEAAQPRMRWF